MTEEIWRDIDGYEGFYQVSNLGNVRRLNKTKPPRILKQSLCRLYLRVDLCRDGKRKSCSVHRLVAETFIPNPDNKPEVNHIDGDKLNNRAENLEWCTSSENQLHAVATGLQKTDENNPTAKLTNEQARFVRGNSDNLSQRQLAKMFSVDRGAIYLIQTGKTYKNAGGKIRTSKPCKFTPRLPDEDREQIRREYKPGVYGCGCHVLAGKFGVDEKTIIRIVKEKSR